MKIENAVKTLDSGRIPEMFTKLYGKRESAIEYQRQRYIKALKRFGEIFGESEDIRIYSASGRSEIGGNHTDHQRGRVLAGAVDMDAIAVVSFREDGIIRLLSEGYELIEISVEDTDVHFDEGGSAALVRGVVAGFAKKGITVGGFDAYCASDVISGGGISSSAAFEVLIATVIDCYYNRGQSTPFEIAKIAWFAENVYFGKKCGLLDQTTSAVGGLVSIDFCNLDEPEIEKIDYPFEEKGYCLCITDTKSSHADLTDDYLAIREEMERVASFFGKSVLREVDPKEFYAKIPELRGYASDRAILRAAHFFAEDERAELEARALKNDDLEGFLRLVNESGESSYELLQNLYSCSRPSEQALPLAIMLSKRVLGERGAVRVHGGGFAGTVQAFVPDFLADAYVAEMDRIFGEGSCHRLSVRPTGGVEIAL